MSKRNNPLEKHSSQAHVSGGSSRGIGDAVQRVIANQGTEHDWRNSITVLVSHQGEQEASPRT